MSQVDSMDEKNEAELLKDKDKLYEYLLENLDNIQKTLSDETDFLNNDINTSFKYIEKIRGKFLKKIEEFTNKLEDILRQNATVSEEKHHLLNNASEKINELFESGKYNEALTEFRSYKERFNERKRLDRDIPKLHRNEHDIDQFFSPNSQLNDTLIQSISSVTTTVKTTTIYDVDEDNEEYVTEKQKRRGNKKIESEVFDKDNEDINNKDELESRPSTFGIRSKQVEDKPQPPPPPTNHVMKIIDQSSTSTTTTTPPQKFRFSTRLPPQPFSNRNLSTPSSIQNNQNHSYDNHEQIRSSASSSIRLSTSSNQDNQIIPLTMTPVVLYQLEDNHFLLMTCAGQDIILFKCPRNRLDRWRLDLIERYSHNVRDLRWHDGLIISMGSIDRQTIYMFTERAFHTKLTRSDRGGISRILPRGNDDESDVGIYFSQRGIGTVYGQHMYHIYLNRNCHWTLSKNLLQDVVHLYDYDLTILFPDVHRFIQFCVNEKTINFLVEMLDSSYAVVFCSVNDCKINDYPSPVILSGADQPLTICSVPIRSKNQYYFYINDPSINILHVINTDTYLHGHPVKAHAICYTEDRRELMIVTNNSICSIDIK